jgi:hypothetical protein
VVVFGFLSILFFFFFSTFQHHDHDYMHCTIEAFVFSPTHFHGLVWYRQPRGFISETVKNGHLMDRSGYDDLGAGVFVHGEFLVPHPISSEAVINMP